MSKYETTDQYRDRYWRKIFNRSTTKDRIIQTQIEIDQVIEQCQKLRKTCSDMFETYEEIGKIRQEQIDLLGQTRTHYTNILTTLEKNNEKMSNS